MSKDVPIVVACWLAFAVIAVDLIDLAARHSASEQLIACHRPEGDR